MMRGILGRRFAVLLLVLLLVAVLIGGFVSELALVNGRAIVAALIADFLRYSLALLILLIIAASVAEDYESRQFERLLTMPLARWQYIAAQTLLIACLCAMLALPAALLVGFYSDVSTGLYWAASLWMELFLLGLLGLLAILSLEKIPLAVFFALAVYLLAKLSGLITLIVAESVKMSEGSAASRVVEFIFNAILYLIPDIDTFADNNVFFVAFDRLDALGGQLLSVVVYALFLIAVCLVDFYRKEFNL
jgi:ABC-type transport system involved in multi-copper enzyme maturation permease subunit